MTSKQQDSLFLEQIELESKENLSFHCFNSDTSMNPKLPKSLAKTDKVLRSISYNSQPTNNHNLDYSTFTRPSQDLSMSNENADSLRTPLKQIENQDKDGGKEYNRLIHLSAKSKSIDNSTKGKMDQMTNKYVIDKEEEVRGDDDVDDENNEKYKIDDETGDNVDNNGIECDNDDQCASSLSSGSTVIHFDLSFLVKDEGTSDEDHKEKQEGHGDDNAEDDVDKKYNDKDDDDDFRDKDNIDIDYDNENQYASSYSSSSTVIHFDLSFIVKDDGTGSKNNENEDDKMDENDNECVDSEIDFNLDVNKGRCGSSDGRSELHDNNYESNSRPEQHTCSSIDDRDESLRYHRSTFIKYLKMQLPIIISGLNRGCGNGSDQLCISNPEKNEEDYRTDHTKIMPSGNIITKHPSMTPSSLESKIINLSEKLSELNCDSKNSVNNICSNSKENEWTDERPSENEEEQDKISVEGDYNDGNGRNNDIRDKGKACNQGSSADDGHEPVRNRKLNISCSKDSEQLCPSNSENDEEDCKTDQSNKMFSDNSINKRPSMTSSSLDNEINNLSGKLSQLNCDSINSVNDFCSRSRGSCCTQSSEENEWTDDSSTENEEQYKIFGEEDCNVSSDKKDDICGDGEDGNQRTEQQTCSSVNYGNELERKHKLNRSGSKGSYEVCPSDTEGNKECYKIDHITNLSSGTIIIKNRSMHSTSIDGEIYRSPKTSHRDDNKIMDDITIESRCDTPSSEENEWTDENFSKCVEEMDIFSDNEGDKASNGSSGSSERNSDIHENTGYSNPRVGHHACSIVDDKHEPMGNHRIISHSKISHSPINTSVLNKSCSNGRDQPSSNSAEQNKEGYNTHHKTKVFSSKVPNTNQSSLGPLGPNNDRATDTGVKSTLGSLSPNNDKATDTGVKSSCSIQLSEENELIDKKYLKSEEEEDNIYDNEAYKVISGNSLGGNDFRSNDSSGTQRPDLQTCTSFDEDESLLNDRSFSDTEKKHSPIIAGILNGSNSNNSGPDKSNESSDTHHDSKISPSYLSKRNRSLSLSSLDSQIDLSQKFRQCRDGGKTISNSNNTSTNDSESSEENEWTDESSSKSEDTISDSGSYADDSDFIVSDDHVSFENDDESFEDYEEDSEREDGSETGSYESDSSEEFTRRFVRSTNGMAGYADDSDFIVSDNHVSFDEEEESLEGRDETLEGEIGPLKNEAPGDLSKNLIASKSGIADDNSRVDARNQTSNSAIAILSNDETIDFNRNQNSNKEVLNCPKPSERSTVLRNDDESSALDDSHDSITLAEDQLLISGKKENSEYETKKDLKVGSRKIEDLVDLSKRVTSSLIIKSDEEDSEFKDLKLPGEEKPSYVSSSDDKFMTKTTEDEDSMNELDVHDSFQSLTKTPRREKVKIVQEGKDFRRCREELAKETFLEFNHAAFAGKLSSVDLSWSNRLRTTAGIAKLYNVHKNCDSKDRKASIELSSKVIDDIYRLRSTLLHEMCHAAAWLIDGVTKPPHGKCFKKWAGIAMENVPDVLVTTTHNYEITFKYAWACINVNCGTVIKRHSRSVNVERHCCGRCSGKLMEIEVPSKTKPEIEHTPRKKKPLSGYNLFVKENSQSVREKLTVDRKTQGILGKVTQPEVLKECARLWRNRTEPR